MNDKINDTYGLIYALACFISPILGATFQEKLSVKLITKSTGQDSDITD